MSRAAKTPPQGADLGEDDDSLGLDGAVFYGSALHDEGRPGAAERYPIFDHGWPLQGGASPHVQR